MTDADQYHIPPQPSVNAAYVLDLKPLIAWFRDLLSEARTAAADARCEARGHRERVVELEARLTASNAALVTLTEQVKQARSNAQEAYQTLLDERRRAKLTPRTGPAVVEAYRLLVGVEPTWEPNNGWDDSADLSDDDARIAAVNILRHLDRVAPGGKP